MSTAEEIKTLRRRLEALKKRRAEVQAAILELQERMAAALPKSRSRSNRKSSKNKK